MQAEFLDFRHIDCMEYLKTCKDNSFDLAITDPPYGIGVNISMGRRKGDKKSEYHKFSGNDKSPPEIEYFNNLFRVSKNQVIWGANHFISRMPYDSSCWLMWDKGFSEEVSFAQYELAWTSFQTTCKKFDKHPVEKNRIHPTQKPVKLYAWILLNYAEQGQKILDTHLGSGSHAIACHYAKCHLTACELDQDYFRAACERIKIETAQMTLL